ncbi:exopolygalacturonase [Quercus suber]|uniref:Polygalacturonase n=1 Tax=Quercus suber TaxID=58331 RepID=A0AAW0LIB3_QUESU
MGLRLNIAMILMLFLLKSVGNVQASIFDVKQYGAKANADITQALTKAWKAACASTGQSKVVVPRGTYMLGTVPLEGPCKGPIELQVIGTLRAPKQQSGDSWVSFNHIDFFTLSGSGTFDGQGKNTWGQSECSKNKYCKQLTINIRFNFITNAIIRDITSLDSKQFHINVLGCKNVTFQHVTIKAPETSVNTDGIHIGRSTGIHIIDTNIGTGDDCVSLGDGSRDITVEKVNCGPGHGISIGSLGKFPNEEPVSGVKVIGCTLTNTMTGVRIKTWPASPTGSASGMHFEDIIMNNVGNPIVIDQVYCPWNQCQAKIPSRIKISNVSFINIRGTSKFQEAVKLVCSKGVPCEKVELHDIDLKYNGHDGSPTYHCINVKPAISGKQNPPACTVKA